MKAVVAVAVLLLAFGTTPDDNDDCNTQADLYYAGCMALPGANGIDCSRNQYCVWHKCMKDRGHTLVPVEYCHDN